MDGTQDGDGPVRDAQLVRNPSVGALGLPDPLTGWNLTLPGDVAADISDAETAIRDLNQAGTTHVGLEGPTRFLLRAESVPSSKIEGLDPDARRLVEAEARLTEGGEAADRIAVEVLGNIASMDSHRAPARRIGSGIVS